ncbi:hypothetical protein OIU76_013556 [Salix suchowensis]|nr:hypothetical protein OIU76_013556 [Salix suchowensis]
MKILIHFFSEKKPGERATKTQHLVHWSSYIDKTSSKGETAEASQGEIFWTGKLRIASKCQRKSSILQRKN